LVASLIKTESDFQINPNHHLSGVYGQSGIYTTYHYDCPFNAKDSKGNIYSCVWILNQCNSQSDGNTLILLKHYKGYSKVGEARARQVVKTMTTIF
jgi:hypothetical protein